ncbi:threonine--tRNA ligase [Pseudomonadota bacterium]|mgnify:FL=1|nr:threonine--tRNA ligase [Pseudomonadota bacterium]|tara:strand:+ start:2488 stop:4425 length:1938 start_codon:yes stop_codon:yes gene_type:complete
MEIKLPDGSSRQLPDGANAFDLANDIGKNLAKSAVAAWINGSQKDLLDPLPDKAEVSIITIDSEDGLEIMRHTVAAQVLAAAVKNLYPSAKLAIGPTIENGFYYDVLFEDPISSEDLQAIQNKMLDIVAKGSLVKKTLHSKSEASKLFANLDETYKQQIIKDADQDDDFQIYTNDDSNFIDLCKGPHLPNLGFIGAFKLTKVSGAYWRGDAKNEMLTRIYGTAWRNQKEQDEYLANLEEAEQRDHRKIGKDMNLFHFQDEAPGMVFWHPRGWTIYTKLEEYIRFRQQESGYHEIRTPLVVDRKLWEKSGHWDKYRENMFITEIDEEHANEKRTNALKPMNCPCHVQVFNQGVRSYRELPMRYAEFGSCHRYEASGTMHGLMRVRGFTQDDGHIFCTEAQIEGETDLFIKLLSKIYKDLGFNDFKIKLSTRPEIRVGSDEIWDQAENSLQSAIEKLGYAYDIDEGDGAFYGPKLDFVLTDALGRSWQCGTLQADFNLPERLDAQYIGEDGDKHYPVMLHRAILGSFERFIGILIENYKGNLPIWLAPIQVVIATVTDDANEYAKEIASNLDQLNIRYRLDQRNEKISYKVRDHMAQKNPMVIVLGKKEIEDQSVNIRRLGNSETQEMSLKNFMKFISEEVKAPHHD